jgi:hypothetical protein
MLYISHHSVLSSFFVEIAYWTHLRALCSCADVRKLAGTTCATVLTRAIFTEGCKSVAAGMNAMDLRRGISMAVDSVVTNLKGMARMINTSEEIAQVTLDLLSVTSLSCMFLLSYLAHTHDYLFIALLKRWVLFLLMVRGKSVSSLQKLWRRLVKRELSPLR